MQCIGVVETQYLPDALFWVFTMKQKCRELTTQKRSPTICPLTA